LKTQKCKIDSGLQCVQHIQITSGCFQYIWVEDNDNDGSGDSGGNLGGDCVAGGGDCGDQCKK